MSSFGWAILGAVSGTVIALGGLTGLHSDDSLHRLVVDSAKRRKPRVCYVPVASGDFEQYVEFFYAQYPTSVCEPTHLELLREVPQDPQALLASQDIVYLGGGSTPVLIAALRVLGLAEVLLDVWRRGGVVCGDSAGAHALFEGCITDSLGPSLRCFADGLALASGTCVAHFDDERAALLQDALTSGELVGPGWGIEDRTALVLSEGSTQAFGTTESGSVRRFVVEQGQITIESLDLEVV